MNTVGLQEAKTHLSRIIAHVSEGQEEYTITHRGVPVARLIPIGKPSREAAKRAFEEILEMRKKIDLSGVSLQELIREVRR